MTESTQAPSDPWDPAYARYAQGITATFNAAGVLHAADVHAAARIAGSVGEAGESARLALAMTIRAVRHGSVCIDIQLLRSQVQEAHEGAEVLPWPDPAAWLDELAASPLVAGADESQARPLRLVHGLLYLDKYWRQELRIARQVDRRTSGDAWSVPDHDRLAVAVDRLLPGEHEARQRLAALVAARFGLVILAGGPGTGKTTAVARILAVLADQPGPAPRIALAAPTGKAAARLSEAVEVAVAAMSVPDRARVGGLHGLTLHRLLGWRPGNQLRYNEFNRLGHDIVVVDEASMLSLTMMSHLVAALRDDARLILVGDPDQLESVDAGVVLADLVDRAGRRAARGGDRPVARPGSGAGPAEPPSPGPDRPGSPDRTLAGAGVVTLTHRFRFGDQREIVELAEAIVAGDADRVVAVVRSAREQVRFHDLPDESGGPQESADRLWAALADGALEAVRADAVTAVRRARVAAESGSTDGALQALGSHQILCAHRHGSFGASVWSRQVEQWGRDELPGYTAGAPWYVGRPVMARLNDVELGVFNGDTGIVVMDPDRGRRVLFGSPGRPLLVNPTRLADVETVHALTIHKSQGSQYDAVTLILPPLGSPLLTRELLYTAVTRARRRVSIVGGEQALRAAVSRPVARASGLREL